LIDENYQEHAHTRVCSALTYSILQCPGIMPSFTGTGAQAHLAVYASRDKTSPAENYGTNYYDKELPEFSE